MKCGSEENNKITTMIPNENTPSPQSVADGTVQQEPATPSGALLSSIVIVGVVMLLAHPVGMAVVLAATVILSVLIKSVT